MLFHSNNGYANASQCYVIRKLHVLFLILSPYSLVLNFNFRSSLLSPRKFSPCTISSRAFSQTVLFLRCSDFAFHAQFPFSTKSSASCVWSLFHLKPTHIRLFSNKQADSTLKKRQLFAAEEHAVALLWFKEHKCKILTTTIIIIIIKHHQNRSHIKGSAVSMYYNSKKRSLSSAGTNSAVP